MISKQDIEAAFGVTVATSTEMAKAIQWWSDMLQNKAPWVRGDVKGLRLPCKIVDEFARLILINSRLSVSGSGRGTYIDAQLGSLKKHLKNDIRLACAYGGILFRPNLSGGRITVDAVPPDRFFPISYDDEGRITDVIIMDQVTRGDTTYTRLVRHSWSPDTLVYEITNRAFSSKSKESIGMSVGLDSLPGWADIDPFKRITGVSAPLFTHFRVPGINTDDLYSPLGQSVFAQAEDLIMEADIHWARTAWEYKGSELAIDAADDLINPRKAGDPPRLPERDNRLFRHHNMDPDTLRKGIQTYSPAIRDSSLYNGMDNMFRRIEFNCNLAYGTISNPQNQDKTAEEVKNSKQRSYAAVCDLQESLEGTLRDIVTIMDMYCTLYNLAPQGALEVTCEWGDGITEDTDKEFARRMQMRTAGMYKDTKFVSWYFGCDEAAAEEYMQAAPPDLYSNTGGGT